MINVLAKSFIPMYKSFTQESFGDLVKFFIKLNENIQLKIIKEHFSIFYQKIKEINNDKENFNFILISSFISFLNLFKNMRNKTAHISIIYNF
ncbi:Abi family protein [bacterium]|nr:Abi family protein [bacterium]